MEVSAEKSRTARQRQGTGARGSAEGQRMREPIGPDAVPAAADPPSGAAIRFATDQFPIRDQLPIWREMVGRTICKVDIEPRAPEQFSSTATLRPLPELGIMTATCS